MVYNKESLTKRLEKLRGYAADINEFGGVPFEVYVKDRRTKYSIERLLLLISENILDFMDHILSSKHGMVSDSYEGIILNAYKKGLLDDDLYGKLKGLGGFRNIIAHEYLELNDEEVYRNCLKVKNMLGQVISAIEKLIKGQGGGQGDTQLNSVFSGGDWGRFLVLRLYRGTVCGIWDVVERFTIYT